MRKQLTLILLLISAVMWGQVPSGYYDAADGLTGKALQSALHDIIDGHTQLSYGDLWDAYEDTDLKDDSTIWDMYSDVPDGTPSYTYIYSDDQCGNYSGEASCYNREHSFPKSWFNEGSPMVSDIFHIVPTDGYVNGKRSNYPYGEVDNPTWTSTNGCKLGPCVTDGYSGTVFEPIDEYKGDFARAYFYMATRYYGEDDSWSGSGMVDGAEPKDWALTMLKRWHEADPVSDKETERNDAIYTYWQHNRNPYIDHPEYVDSVWNGETTVSSDTTVVDPDATTEITMSAADYQLIVDYVNADASIPNTDDYPDNTENYYGASAYYSNFDIRSDAHNSIFTSSDEAINAALVDAFLPAYASSAIVGSNFTVTYATYDGSSSGIGSMDFYCSSIDPLTFVSGFVASNEDVKEGLWSNVTICPNPSSTSIYLSTAVEAFTLMNMSGQVVCVRNQLSEKEPIDISFLTSGVYFANIKVGESSQMLKFIKK